MSRSHDVTISGFDLDRLEAELAKAVRERDEAQEENEEQARLLGMSAEREANLRGKVGRLEDKAERWRQDALAYMRKSDKLRELNVELEAKVKGLEEERDEARAKIERQAERIRYLEGATNHACGTPLTIALSERDEALAALREARNDSDEWQSLHAALFAEAETLRQERDESIRALTNIAALPTMAGDHNVVRARKIAQEALRNLEAAK